MEKIQKYCDACGKEIHPSHFKSARVEFSIDEWGGGSLGGPSEDVFIQEADLCSVCAHKLKRFLEHELNIKPHHPC